MNEIKLSTAAEKAALDAQIAALVTPTVITPALFWVTT